MTNGSEVLDQASQKREWAIRISVVAAGFIVLALVFIPACKRAAEAARRAACGKNLKLLGVALKAYADDHQGAFPALSTESGPLLFPLEALCPKYLPDSSLFSCPSDILSRKRSKPSPGDSQNSVAAYAESSYCYLGYILEDETQGLLALEQIGAFLVSGSPLPERLTVPEGYGAAGRGSILALKEGAERFLLTDINCPAGSAKAQSRVPVVLEYTIHHTPEGMNILFMDGHVEFRQIRESVSGFPATPKFLAAVEDLVKLHQSLPKERVHPAAAESPTAPANAVLNTSK